MKNKLILFMLLISLITYSQTVKDSLSTSQNVERLIDKYGGKISEGFNNVVEKTTPVAKEGFYIAVKLNIAHGIGLLLPLLFFFIFGYIFIKEYNRINNLLNSDNIPRYMNKNYGPMEDGNSSPLLWISLVSTCILFSFALFSTISGIKHLIAPEWYAIKDIIELFK
jgi:hypothetical protein